jgi:hypothetical protein
VHTELMLLVIGREQRVQCRIITLELIQTFG